MVGNRSVRAAGGGLLLAAALGVTGAVLHAQPGQPAQPAPPAQPAQPAAAPPARLSDFPDAQRALAPAAIDERAFFNSLLTSLERGQVSFYFSTAALKADEEMRVTLVRTLGPLLPRIVDSAGFTGMYASARDEAARSRAGTPPVHPSIARADSISDLEMRVRDMQERLGVAGISRRDRSSLEGQIATARSSIAQFQRQAQDPAVRAADQTQMDAATQAYETQRQATLASLETELPSDIHQLVRQRVEGFVAGCRDVNFRARTVTTGGVTRFENPEDEARPRIWKLCFRAGQRTVAEARRVATRWLGSTPRAARPPRARRPRH